MDINRCFDILEISPDVTYEEAKTAYRLMCQVWHPDKYNHSEQLQAKATSKIKEINAAWSQIEDYFKNATSRKAEARETERRAREERERSQRNEQERGQKEAENAKQHNQQRKQEHQASQTSYTRAIKSLGSFPVILFSIITVAFVVAMFSGKKSDNAPAPAPAPVRSVAPTYQYQSQQNTLDTLNQSTNERNVLSIIRFAAQQKGPASDKIQSSEPPAKPAKAAKKK